METLFDRYLQDPAMLRGVMQEQLVLQLTEAIARGMKKNKISQGELAKRLGKSVSYVTRLLDGRRNMPLQEFANALTVCGVQAHVTISSLKFGDSPVSESVYSQAGTAQEA